MRFREFRLSTKCQFSFPVTYISNSEVHKIFQVTEDAKENKKDVAEDLKPIIKENTEESMQSKDVVHEMKDELISKTKKDLEEILKDIKDSKPLSVVASKLMDGDELKLVKEIEEVKSKIIGSESKLNEVRFLLYVVSFPQNVLLRVTSIWQQNVSVWDIDKPGETIFGLVADY